MRGRGPYGPSDLPLFPLKGCPVPLTWWIVSSLPTSGSPQVLRNMEGLGASIILLVRQDLVSPEFFFEVGLGKRRLVSRYCYLCRLGLNLLGGLSRYVNSGNGEGWMAAKSESSFRWWRSPPGWIAWPLVEYVPIPLFIFRLALCGDDGAERFCGLQPCCGVAQDCRETQVVLCSSLIWRGQVDLGAPEEPDARVFFCMTI